MDGRFPTVKSPNPENAEALKSGFALAQKEKAELVAATDPDCDRLGVAVRTASGEMKLLSGNQIGSVLAWYRAKTFFDRGILNKENATSRRHHQDFRHERPAESDRGEIRIALHRYPHRFQI